jgi:transposase-like protein
MAKEFPTTLLELERQFPDEAACREYLTKLRWPEGVVCPVCKAREGLAIRRGVWRCKACRKEVSVMAGTVFQDSKLSLMLWIRAMWLVTSQKNGVSAMGLQRVLGLGSYKTAWTMLHKLRRAMVRPNREQLTGMIEVDEAYWGGLEEGVRGRQTEDKALIAVAVEVADGGMGRIRLRHIPDVSRATLHSFINQSVEPGSTVQTDGLPAYRELKGYTHDWQVQRQQPKDAAHLLPRAHRVISLLKRWMLGTHQGAIASEYLQDYLDEFTFRFNRRTSASRGKLFYRLAQQAVQVAPTTYDLLGHHHP